MPLFNIALLPRNAIWQENFARLAGVRFAAQSDGYLLGKDALAHVTLCQFEAADLETAGRIFAALPDKMDQDIVLEKFVLRAGSGQHENFLWAWFLARTAARLMQRQAVIHDFVAAEGLTVHTPKADYTPHLTLARLTRAVDVKGLGGSYADEIITMRPALGLSTPLGALRREIS